MNVINRISYKATIVIISNTHWHYSWQTGNSVAAGFAQRGYHVIFIEPIPKRWPHLFEVKRVLGRLTSNSRKAGFVSQVIPEGVELLTPLSLPDVGRFAQVVNRYFFIPRVVSHLRKLIKEQQPVILIHTLPIKAAITIQTILKPNISIYRCVHDWPNDPYSQNELAENELLKQVDMAWADCEQNFLRVKAVQPNAVLMPPAVDLSLFTSVSYTRSGYSKPLCTYFGSIGVNRDLELLRQISHRYRLRLIGSVMHPLEGFSEKTEIFGAVPHEQVPALIKGVDILLLPYLNRPHVKGLIPAKLFECLITGKPIVAFNLTTIDQYRDLVYLCHDYEGVFHSIEAALTEDKSLPARRIACAKENSWDNRITQMEQHIHTLLSTQFKQAVGR